MRRSVRLCPGPNFQRREAEGFMMQSFADIPDSRMFSANILTKEEHKQASGCSVNVINLLVVNTNVHLSTEQKATHLPTQKRLKADGQCPYTLLIP